MECEHSTSQSSAGKALTVDRWNQRERAEGSSACRSSLSTLGGWHLPGTGAGPGQSPSSPVASYLGVDVTAIGMIILQTMDMLVQLLFVLGLSGTFGAGGAYFGSKAVKTGGDWRTFRKANRNRGVDAIQDGDQPVIVDGTVKPNGESLSSPFTGEECVAYEYEIQVTDHNRPWGTEMGEIGTRETERKSSDGWTTVDEGSDETVFDIETETARVRVDPSHADITLEYETESEQEIREESPEALRDHSSIDLGTVTLTDHQRYRYVENELEVGEPGSALGKLVQGREYADSQLHKTDSNEFIVSDASPQTTRNRLLKDCLTYSAIGLVASSIALIIPALVVLS